MSQNNLTSVVVGNRASISKPRLGLARKRAIIRFLFILPTLIFLAAMFVFPIIYNMIMSLENYTTISIATGNAPFVGLQNYIQLFQMPLMSQATWNTLEFVIGSILFQVIIGMAMALFFKRDFPFSTFLRTLILLPWLLPLIVTGTIFKWIFDQSHGVLNYILMQLHIIHAPIGWLISPNMALISVIITNIWVGIPFDMVLFHSGLQQIPDELYEASSLDGANRWQQFIHVTIPLLRPVLAIVLMLALIYTLKVFDIIQVMTGGGPANTSQILSTWSYTLSFQDMSFGQGAAVGNIMIVISLFFSYFYLRFTKES